jgi:hypothetical protein
MPSLTYVARTVQKVTVIPLSMYSGLSARLTQLLRLLALVAILEQELEG